MTGRVFAIPKRRPLRSAGSWPTGSGRLSETLGGNREYGAVDALTWREVREMIDEERATIGDLCASVDLKAAYDEWQRTGEPDFEGGYLLSFDLGTNAVSAALKAARCLPFYSCNAGAFGHPDHEAYPLVSFFCREAILPIVQDAAMRAGAVLEHNHAGGLTAAVARIDGMLDFAEALHERRTAIRRVRLRRHPRGLMEESTSTT